jgi:signal transduction histidine kinase/CheY-like chemotaxis protein
MQAPARSELVDALSRELVVICARDGTIRELDARAARILCLEPPGTGRSLLGLATPGTESILRDLLERAARDRVSGIETSIVCDGRPRTISWSGAPSGDEIVLLGSLFPDDHGVELRRIGDAMSELAELHRQTERQRVELASQRDELESLNAELADSNQGLRVLHVELDEKSDALRRAVDVKGRVVANVSHEFRTPLHTILGLTKLLLDRTDGELSEEQETQVRFVRQAAETLTQLVDDLLDLSKLEAGKAGLRIQRFTADEVIAALRGMMRPVVDDGDVELVFVSNPAVPTLETDEGKLSQILRNLVSNALKFTERGKVTIRARHDAGLVSFAVEDTGIGIAPEHLDSIFEEFSQVESRMQGRVRGTGLGLSLSRRLAELLGGRIEVESRVGEGSTFTVTIPAIHDDVRAMQALADRAKEIDPKRAPILVVEDDRTTLFLYERYLRDSGFQVLPARTTDDAREIIQRVRPAAIILDVMLEGESTWGFLRELKDDEATHDIPVMVVTVIDQRDKARALGADEFWLKPFDPKRLLSKLASLGRRGAEAAKILVIDDDETARYIIRKLLAGTEYRVVEAASGKEGIRLARAERPNLILLDFVLDDALAFDVLDELKTDMTTRAIPVVIHTAKDLDEVERQRLSKHAATIVSKRNLSRELAIARIREALVSSGISPDPQGGGGR